MAVLLLGQVLTTAATYYVAIDGSDSNPGTLSQPFATFEKAKEAIRQLKSAGLLTNGATVYVRGGTYCATKALALSSADSGHSAAEPIVWSAYPGETVDWIGGLPLTNWQIWQTNILCVNTSTQGVSGVFRTLLFGGQRQIRARVPNYNPADPYGLTSGFCFMVSSASSNSFTYKSGDLAKASMWANPTLGEVYRFYSKNYGNWINPITAVNPETRTIQMTAAPLWPPENGDRYYIRNLFEELDTTNEFYLNPSTHLVYWFAPSPPGSTPAYAVLATNLVTLGKGTSNVWFQGFTFDGACSSAVTMTNTLNCLVSGGTIRNAGDHYLNQENGMGYGVYVNGGINNGVATNTIYSIGADGVMCSGGTMLTLSRSSNYAAYNTIFQVGVEKKEVGGVRLYGTGNRASHNLIFNCPRWGVFSQESCASMVEYNHIYNVCLETDDTAPIYFYANPNWLSARQSVVRYNYVHDCTGYGASFGNSGTRTNQPVACQGIYIDALGNGVDIYGNIVDRVAYGTVFINGGRDNRVHNNIFLQTTNWETIFYCFPTNNSTWLACYSGMVSGWNSVQGQSAWSSVRGMNIAPTNAFADGLTAGGNEFCTNIVLYQCRGNGIYNFIYAGSAGPNYTKSNSWDFNCVYAHGNNVVSLIELPVTYATWGSGWQSLGVDVHSISSVPQFRLSAPGDYYVQNAAVLALGFRQIPASQIGPTNLFWLPAAPEALHTLEH